MSENRCNGWCPCKARDYEDAVARVLRMFDGKASWSTVKNFLTIHGWGVQAENDPRRFLQEVQR